MILVFERAIIIPNSDDIETQRTRCGRFILATNVLDRDLLSTDDALREYKAQQRVERGFCFLKDPMFFDSSVFLKLLFKALPKSLTYLRFFSNACRRYYLLPLPDS